MKGRIVYWFCMAVFVLLILFSNTLVGIVAGNSFIRANTDINTVSRKEIKYAIDSYSDDDQSLFERVKFVGWAFHTGDSTEGDTEIGIALLNEKKDMYIFKSSPNIMRVDVNQLSGDTYSHGFNYFISTIQVPSGQYTVYIYCGDKNQIHDIVATDYVLIKNGKNVSIYNPSSKEEDTVEETINISDEVDIPLSSIDGTANTYLDIVSVNEDGTATVAGWGYVPEKDAAAQQIQLLLTFSDGTAALFDAQQSSRPDVAEAFSSDLYTMAGFNALIPAEGLATQSFTVSVLVKDADGLHTSPEMLTSAQAGAALLEQ